jgi:rhodanese-related sulfurtransferase
MKGPKIIFCRSGGRSGQACQFLAQNGLEDLFNGGGFMQLHAALEHYKK